MVRLLLPFHLVEVCDLSAIAKVDYRGTDDDLLRPHILRRVGIECPESDQAVLFTSEEGFPARSTVRV